LFLLRCIETNTTRTPFSSICVGHGTQYVRSPPLSAYELAKTRRTLDAFRDTTCVQKPPLSVYEISRTSRQMAEAETHRRHYLLAGIGRPAVERPLLCLPFRRMRRFLHASFCANSFLLFREELLFSHFRVPRSLHKPITLHLARSQNWHTSPRPSFHPWLPGR
jgi:hypothetical protein